MQIWFNPNSYASLEKCDHKPAMCIAPTLKDTRCSLKIEDNDVQKASILRQQAERLLEGSERDEKIGGFILLHCCEKHHRPKLNNDQTGCLDKVVERYRDGIDSLAPDQAEDEQSSIYTLSSQEDTISMRQSTIAPESPHQSLALESTASMRLRSGRIVGPLPDMPENYHRNTSYFSPYKTNPKGTLKSALDSDVSRRSEPYGVVYGFAWPAHPGFVKLGYSGTSTERRMNVWSKCHPGAVVIGNISVQYPRRIERLIHVQLAQFRRNIGVCDACGDTHNEWFEQSDVQVKQILRDWQDLLHRAPLYDTRGLLTAKWRQIIEKVNGEMTARILIDIYDAQAALEAAEIHDTEIEAVLEQDVQAAIELSLQYEEDVVEILEEAPETLGATPEHVAEEDFTTEIDDATLLDLVQKLSPTDIEAIDAANAAWELELLATAGYAPEPTPIPASINTTHVPAPEAIDIDTVVATTQQYENTSLGQAIQPTPMSVAPLVQSTAELAGQVVSTALQIAQQQDEILTFFEDFMTMLMTESESHPVEASGVSHNGLATEGLPVAVAT